MAERTWTILEVLRWTTDYFRDKSIDDARPTAEILLAHVLSVERITLYLNYDKPLNPVELAAYRGCIKRRMNGEPVQYITGKQEFWSRPFKVSPAVLIPRADTEVLMEQSLKAVADVPAPRILEIGVGSGALAVSLGLERSDAQVFGCDISAPALLMAHTNRDTLDADANVSFFQGNLLDAVRPHPSFHLIISNPPYVTEAEFALLPREIREHEPRTALWAGRDGLDVVRAILRRAPDFLIPGGLVLLEIGSSQGKAVLAFVGELGVYGQVEVIRDYSGRDRVLRAVARSVSGR